MTLIDVQVGEAVAVPYDPTPMLSFDTDWLTPPPRIYVSTEFSGDGALAATATQQYVCAGAFSGAGTLSPVIRPAPLILATASGPTNASRDVTITFPGYVPKTNDMIILSPAAKANPAPAATFAGWTRTPALGAGGTAVIEHFIYHFVTQSEQDAGTDTFTLTNYWNTAQTGDVIGAAVRHVSQQVTTEAISTQAGSGTTHALVGVGAANVRFDSSLPIGLVARALPGVFSSVGAGWSSLEQSNVNHGRALVRRDTLTQGGVAVAGVNTVASPTSAYSGLTILLVADFPGTYRPAPFTGGGTLTATVKKVAPVAANFSGGGTLSATVTPKFTAAFSGGGALSATAEPPWTPLAIPGLAAWIDPTQDKAAYGSNENTLTAAMAINEVGNYTVGLQFQPTASGRITHIRANVGGGSHTFTLWTDAGVRLSTIVDVSSGPREWRSVALPTPIDVVAGTTYMATFSTDGVGFGRNSGAILPSETPNVTVLSHRYGVGVDVFPYAGSGPNHYGVDVVYQKATFADGQVVTSYTSHDPGGRLFTTLGPSYEPIFRSTMGAGGKPRLQLVAASGVSGYGLLNDSYNPGTTGLTYVFVGSAVPSYDYGMMMTWACDIAHGYELRNNDSSLGVQCIGDYQGGGPATSSAFTRTSGVDYVLIMRVDMSDHTMRLYINDTEQFAVSSVSAMPNVSDKLRIGYRPEGYFWTGLIAEAMVISGPISASDRAKLMTYLRNKHGQSFPAV